LIHETVAQNQSRIVTLRGSGRLSIETPELAQSVSFELDLHRPDSVLVRLEGPFGMELGAALLTRNEFLLYNGLENQLITGPATPAALARFLRVTLTFDDLLSLFTGGRFFSEDLPEKADVTDGDKDILLQYDHAGGIRRYGIDAQTLLIHSVEYLRKDGKVAAEQRFSDFRTVNGVTLPHRVRVTLPLERRMIAISYSTLSVNGGGSDLRLQVPENARRVVLD
jgi:hypothetical protein